MNLGPTLETPRLILRPHRLDDFDACCFLHNDPEAVRMIYRQPPTREESWHRMLRFVGHWALLGYGMLLVLLVLQVVTIAGVFVLPPLLKLVAILAAIATDAA